MVKEKTESEKKVEGTTKITAIIKDDTESHRQKNEKTNFHNLSRELVFGM